MTINEFVDQDLEENSEGVAGTLRMLTGRTFGLNYITLNNLSIEACVVEWAPFSDHFILKFSRSLFLDQHFFFYFYQ